MEAHCAQPAAAPGPMAGDGIDDRADQNTIHTIDRKFCALGHSTRNDGSRRSTENGLEDKEGPGRISAAIVSLHKKVGRADESANIRTKHQAEANYPKDDTAQTQVHKVFHNDVAGIFSSCKTCLYHGKAGLHKKYHKRAYQHPNRVRCYIFFHNFPSKSNHKYLFFNKKEAYPLRDTLLRVVG